MKKFAIEHFKVGQVWKMVVAPRSLVTKPYYVVIKEVGEDYIVTDIPGEHSLKICLYNNWDYQILRMRYVGDSRKDRELVLDQRLI